ncbi:MAG: hypothetical protein ING14_01210 [Burkholderiales bacterium]|nr:hypothetical protein [Burkholderiales bacterium]
MSGLVLLVLAHVLLATSVLDQCLLFECSPRDKTLCFVLPLGVYGVTMAIAAQWLLQRERLSERSWLLA